ncbi:MAG TPA: DegV family protein [Flexilinea sp.]|nr:DegV family protein [Flexilinea sp.]
MPFHILVDSGSDLPKSLTNSYQNFSLLYLSYIIDGEPGPNDMSGEEFYRRLRNGSFSVTSQINPEAFIEEYERLIKEGQKEILYIGFSSGLSGTYGSGKMAAETVSKKYPDSKIFTVDTLSASLGYGLLIDYAIRQRDSGKSIEQVRDWLEENKLKMNHWFTVDDLHFLERGGRVSASSAWFGSALNIKPVMNMDDAGHLIPREKIMGRNKAIKRLYEKMKEMAVEPQNQRIFISHGDCMEDVEKLEKLIHDNLGVNDFTVNYVGNVIGSHTGPGVLALFFLGNHR